MKKRNIYLVAICVITIAAICGTYFLRKLYFEANRKTCFIQMRNMHQTINSFVGMEGINPGDAIPGGIRGLLMRRGYSKIPSCPSGGAYTFTSESHYIYGRRVHEIVHCSHAKDLGHVYPYEGMYGEQADH